MKELLRCFYNFPTWSKLVCFLFFTCLVYTNALNNPFHYDDFHSIVENPHLRSWKNIPSFFTNPSTFSVYPENAMYRPFLLFTFCINYTINAYDPFGYHLVNLMLHLGCIIVLWGLSRQFLGKTQGVWVAVIFFGIHPLHSECINYISSRSEVLSGFFFLFSLWCYGHIRFSSGVRFFLVTACYCLALLSKSIAILLPFIVVGTDLIMNRSVFYEKWLKIVLGFVATVYVFGLRNWIVRATIDAPVRTFDEQFWTQIKALVFYIKMIIWPSNQNADHQFLISDSLFDPISFFSFLFLVSFIIWLYRQRQARPFLVFCTICFLLALAPSIVVPLNVLVNEHRMYLPSVFFSLGIGYIWNIFRSKNHKALVIMYSVGLIAVIALSVASVKRNSVWRSSLSLWEDSARKAPLMARPYIFWGKALEEKGDYVNAINIYKYALTRDPDHFPLYSQLGKLFHIIGDRTRSHEVFKTGLQLFPQSGEMWFNFAEVLREQELWDDTLLAYLQALRYITNDDVLHNNLGNTFQMLNRPDEAIIQHRLAIKINPNDARSWVNLGNAYMMKSLNDSSLIAFQKALEINEEYSGAWISLGSCFEVLGRKQEALNAYSRARKLDPTVEDYVETREKMILKGYDYD